ncbi:MAG: hypothetical protein LC793_24095 [Thermomicrobia bacterium]|nr:hypothetical protein [Thermomicrobia bacterium]
MALYSATARTLAAAAYTAGGVSAAYVNLRPVSTDRVYLREIGIFNTTATAIPIALIRATGMGVATTSNLGQAEDPAAPASTANLDSAWSTNITAGAAVTILRRAMIGAGIGNGVIWMWGPNECVLTNLNSLALINPIGTGQVLDVYFRWDD